MKRLPPFLAAAAILAAVLFAMSASQSTSTADEPPERLLRHVVLFKFKADASKDQIKEVEQAFAKLPEQIDAIHAFEWGTDNSPEMLAQGYTHCFLVTFKTEEARAEYLPHAAHQAFVAKLKPILDSALVVDYWTPAKEE